MKQMSLECLTQIVCNTLHKCLHQISATNVWKYGKQFVILCYEV